MIKKIFRVAIFFSFLIVASCKKSNKEFEKIKLLEQSELEIHNQQVNAWMRMFQVNEQIKTNTLKLSKTVYSKGQFITSFQVGELGTAIYFISEKNKLITYGIKTELNDGKKSGLVEIFDFQKMDKRGLKFSAGKLTSILTYPKEQHFNNNSLNGQSNQTIRTSSFISGIRKFFCELFGGYWDATIAGNATNSGGSCTTTSNGEGQVESILNSDGGGGSFNWGPIYTNINNPSFFENNFAFWQSYLNTGGGGPVLGGTQIPQLTLEQKRDFLITTLNLDLNQQFYLVNTDNAITSEFEFLMTNSAINKIDVAIYAIDYISTNLNLPFTTITSWFFTNPNPDTQLIYLLDFIPYVFDPNIFNDPDINFGGVFGNSTNSSGPGITAETKDHVLKGNIKGGKAGGFHYFKNNNITARLKPGAKQTKVGPAALGMFKSKVQIKTTDPNNPWLDKVAESTFFPPSWDEQKVLEAINVVFGNCIKDDNDPTKNRYTGTYTFTESNITYTINIQLFLKKISNSQNIQDMEIITAFPKY